MSDKTSSKRFGYLELVGACVVALLVGFYAGTVFVDAYRANKAPAAPPAQQTQAAPGVSAPDPKLAARIGVLEELVRSNPSDTASWVELGNLYFDTDQPARAIPAYEKALELNPASADVWTDLGIMYRQANRPKDALAAFDKASALDPRHQNARFNKGVVLLHDLGDRPGALKAWEELLKVNPQATTPDGRPLREMVEGLGKGK